MPEFAAAVLTGVLVTLVEKLVVHLVKTAVAHATA